MNTVRDRELARKLRMRGLTYAEINKNLGTSHPKSTMSGWCKGLVIPEKAKHRLLELSQERLRRYRTKALVANKQILENRQAEAKARALCVLNDISADKSTLKLALAMLHWGEGAKSKSYRGLSIGNSDPKLLRTYMGILEHCYDVEHSRFRARILCRDDQDQEKLKHYWSEQLGIGPDNFYKTYVDARTVGKATSKEYMGVCVLSCAGTDIQLELEQITANLLLN